MRLSGVCLFLIIWYLIISSNSIKSPGTLLLGDPTALFAEFLMYVTVSF